MNDHFIKIHEIKALIMIVKFLIEFYRISKMMAHKMGPNKNAQIGIDGIYSLNKGSASHRK